MTEHPRNARDWLEDGESSLSRLLAQAQRLQRVQARLHAALDARLAGAVSVAGLDQGVLTLVTPRAGLATRLRLEAPALLRALPGSGPEHVKEIRVRVAPLPVLEPAQRQSRALPATAREALERFARDNGYDSLSEWLAAASPQKDEAQR